MFLIITANLSLAIVVFVAIIALVARAMRPVTVELALAPVGTLEHTPLNSLAGSARQAA
jgi:hypothetical protein